MNIASSKKLTSVSVKRPILRRTAIGSKPKHHFDQNPNPTESYVSVKEDPFAKTGQTVWADIPDKNADGTPTLVERQEEIDLRPRNPYVRGAIGLGLGAAAGGAPVRR